MSSSNGLLVTAVKTKAKYRFYAAVNLFNILQIYNLNKIVYFSKTYYNTKFHDPTLSGASTTHTSDVRN
jgi:hypothetical protein